MSREDILVTGAAGFIGFHVASRLLESGRSVLGIDNLNDYYDPALKTARLASLAQHPEFRFVELDIADRAATAALFAEHRFSRVVHLAAQPGVRRSLSDPHAYVDANITGFLDILEGCRHNDCGHLVYASSSSVYGANTGMPFSTEQNVDHPVSLYGATKKANELMAHAYAHLFGIPCTGLRFFTVYGPWGRPDMAIWLFTAAIVAGKPIRLFNEGDMQRDFTYVGDVAEAIVRLIDTPAAADPAWSSEKPDPASGAAPWRIYNIGNHTPIDLRTLVRVIEDAVGKKAIVELMPMQPGDVHATYADVEALSAAVGFAPRTPIEVGVGHFVKWYREHYHV
ncbi:NAD-dependent epimerase [Xanthobacteraceae bacterium Astr-EGSB]|uniref:NAD-dependent epimerase n=1 Tax=Astrobacterium formosum TaxID=3069710 RepID=UPI0027AECBFE|nr:NAD-dependent epimerase [Xanthobacteraceae bacterium Astr-EGSB]